MFILVYTLIGNTNNPRNVLLLLKLWLLCFTLTPNRLYFRHCLAKLGKTARMTVFSGALLLITRYLAFGHPKPIVIGSVSCPSRNVANYVLMRNSENALLLQAFKHLNTNVYHVFLEFPTKFLSELWSSKKNSH